MDIAILIISLLGILCSLVFSFCIFHLMKWAFHHLNLYRVDLGLRAFPSKIVWVLSFLSGLSFLI